MIETLPLRRVARVANGGTPTSDEANWGGEIPWATPVDLGLHHGGAVEETARTLTEHGARTGSSTVPAGSVLVSTRAPIGYVARTNVTMAFNQGCRGLIPGDRIDARFLAFALLAAHQELNARGQGSTFSELSADGLASVPVPVPPIDEQRRIVDFLDTETARLGALIGRRQQLLERTEERLRSALEASMGAKGWPRPALSHLLARRVSDGPHETPEFVEAGVPFLSVDAFVDEGLSFDGCRHVRDEDNKRYSRKVRPRRGDVLMTKAAAIGRVALVDTEREFNVWSPVAVLRPNPTLLRADYLAHVLRTDDLQTQMQLAATSNTQQNLAMSDIGSLRVPLPPLPEQQRLATAGGQRLLRQQALRRLVAEQVSRLRERRQTLITAAVTGQLDVTTARGGRS